MVLRRRESNSYAVATYLRRRKVDSERSRFDNRRDRLTTILVAPLMTCSARIPVYTLIISAFVPATHVWGLFNLQGLGYYTVQAVFRLDVYAILDVTIIAAFFVTFANLAVDIVYAFLDPRVRYT